MRKYTPLTVEKQIKRYNALMRIVFFGSFQHYSSLILKSLIDHPDIEVVSVVTTPPMPVGRKQIITKTPVHLLAEQHNIPVFIPSLLPDDMNLCRQIENKPDYFITAGYGKILPESWLKYPKLGSLNLHFSLLPAYRGANPAEWAIMCGETKTGITLIEMSNKLDGGDIIAQAEIPISDQDTRETLYQKLYALGAEKLPGWLLKCAESEVLSAHEQPKLSPTPYAALLKRDDGFIPWSTIQNLSPTIENFPSKHLQKALSFSLGRDPGFQRAIIRSEAKGVSTAKPIETEHIIKFLSRLPRALAGYPSLWTIVNTTKGEKRMKIISFEPYIIVQLEGGQSTHFNQIKNQIR